MEKQITNTTITSTQVSQSFDSTPTITNTFTNNVVPATNYFQPSLTSTTLPIPLPTTTSTSMDFSMTRSYPSTTLLTLQQAEDANQHLKEVVVHEGQIMWACKFPKCWTLFKSQNSLNNHIRRYHMQHMQTNQGNTGKNNSRNNIHISKIQASEIHTSVSGIHSSVSGIQISENDSSSSSNNNKIKENAAILYQCDIPGCVRAYTSLPSLEKHREVHEKQIYNLPTLDKEFKCDEVGCTKSFDKFKHLVAHYRKHSNDKTFNCNEVGCDKKFFHPDSLSRHMFKSHKKMSDGTAIKFKCKYEDCGKEFKSTYHWKKHNMTHPHPKFEGKLFEE
jgi:hypothetical protein